MFVINRMPPASDLTKDFPELAKRTFDRLDASTVKI